MASDNTSAEERVLLVEGQDDMHVVRHLRQSCKILPAFCVRNKGGINKLLSGIRGEILIEGRTAVGILVDANDDSHSRWQAVTGRIRKAGIQSPSSPEPNGTIIDNRPSDDRPVERPRVGVWLMPDNKSPGELEDFIARMIPAKDPVWPLSDTYINNIPEGHRKFNQGKILQAKVHAWLATRSKPRPMGTAIETGDLNIEVETSQLFIKWLRELFK